MEQRDEIRATPPPPPAQMREEISVRAYHIFLERMRTGAPGDEQSDWRQAETEIRKRHDL